MRRPAGLHKPTVATQVAASVVANSCLQAAPRAASSDPHQALAPEVGRLRPSMRKFARHLVEIEGLAKIARFWPTSRQN